MKTPSNIFLIFILVNIIKVGDRGRISLERIARRATEYARASVGQYCDLQGYLVHVSTALRGYVDECRQDPISQSECITGRR